MCQEKIKKQNPEEIELKHETIRIVTSFMLRMVISKAGVDFYSKSICSHCGRLTLTNGQTPTLLLIRPLSSPCP